MLQEERDEQDRATKGRVEQSVAEREVDAADSEPKSGDDQSYATIDGLKAVHAEEKEAMQADIERLKRMLAEKERELQQQLDNVVSDGATHARPYTGMHASSAHAHRHARAHVPHTHAGAKIVIHQCHACTYTRRHARVHGLRGCIRIATADAKASAVSTISVSPPSALDLIAEVHAHACTHAYVRTRARVPACLPVRPPARPPAFFFECVCVRALLHVFFVCGPVPRTIHIRLLGIDRQMHRQIDGWAGGRRMDRVSTHASVCALLRAQTRKPCKHVSHANRQSSV